jgi:hypothetical protein
VAECCQYCIELLIFNNILGISGVPQQLLASQEGFTYEELVCWLVSYLASRGLLGYEHKFRQLPTNVSVDQSPSIFRVKIRHAKYPELNKIYL